MKVYISGPITGIENRNKNAFEKAEEKLTKKGHKVINPLKLDHDYSKEWSDYMKQDLKALLECDSICLLNNWSKSKGASLEYLVATTLGLKIINSNIDG